MVGEDYPFYMFTLVFHPDNYNTTSGFILVNSCSAPIAWMSHMDKTDVAVFPLTP